MNGCSWCREPWTRAHHCDKPADFEAEKAYPPTPAQLRGKARRFVLTPLGWETAGYRLIDGYYQKEAARCDS